MLHQTALSFPRDALDRARGRVTGTPERTYSNLQQVLVRYPAETFKFPRSAAILARVLHNILLCSKPGRLAGMDATCKRHVLRSQRQLFRQRVSFEKGRRLEECNETLIAAYASFNPLGALR
jgi:hypothetical protein